ncbi:maltase A2-like [Episyrphus balteatus]|uniref:maltase A2-like n=1 Tax=Episyrphus balteatus TaxID=286459 RepID=UPI0024868734|nr:maltase A2-like [Episyrphus balteatus]
MAKFTLFVAVLACLSLTSCFGVKTDWWEDASIYQIYPRSWKDSNGDGVGDLKGITQKLDHLKDIGMTATWISPFFKSPMADNGYDITDFYDIDPVFGTMADFDALIKKAKSLGIKIILDFVPNHSSTECEWFKKSVNREDGYDDFYMWADGIVDPNNSSRRLVPSTWQSTFGGSMWEWNDKRQQFYLHQFLDSQPDFNFRNPKVHEVMKDILKFWLDRGVDGFRIDAVKHIYEKVNDDGTYPDFPPSDDPNDTVNKANKVYTQHQVETKELLYSWRQFLEDYQKENGGDTRVLLAESYSPVYILSDYISNGTHSGAQLPMNFKLMDLEENSNARDVEKLTNEWMDFIWPKHQTANWVVSNHDAPRAIDRFGSMKKKDLSNILLTSLPGVAITYYGEEIGMTSLSCQLEGGECPWSETRQFGRSPFQWNDQIAAGFSNSSDTWLPVVDNYKEINVKVEQGYARSSLNVFKNMQKLRRSPAFKAFKNRGGFSYGAVNDQVFQIVRSSRFQQYRILLNMCNKTETVTGLSNSKGELSNMYTYAVVTSNSPHDIGDKADLRKIVLEPYEAVVLKKTFKLF